MNYWWRHNYLQKSIDIACIIGRGHLNRIGCGQRTFLIIIILVRCALTIDRKVNPEAAGGQPWDQVSAHGICPHAFNKLIRRVVRIDLSAIDRCFAIQGKDHAGNAPALDQAGIDTGDQGRRSYSDRGSP